MWSAVRIFSGIGVFEFCYSAGSVSDGWRIRRENELVGHAEVSDDRERHPKSKIGNYQKRGFELEKPERKFE